MRRYGEVNLDKPKSLFTFFSPFFFFFLFLAFNLISQVFASNILSFKWHFLMFIDFVMGLFVSRIGICSLFYLNILICMLGFFTDSRRPLMQLVFLVFTGEAWGYLGSRRFLLELDLHSDFVKGIDSTLIEMVFFPSR